MQFFAGQPGLTSDPGGKRGKQCVREGFLEAEDKV